MVISDETRITGDIGGQPKQTYWTPDGRQVRAMPDMHEFAKTNAKGQIIESGVRDANYDRGWLPMKPTELKPYCPNCGQWHNTEKEIIECGRKQKALVQKSLKQARKDNHSADNDRISRLESDMGELKGLLQELLKEVRNGPLFQRTGAKPKANTRQQDNGANEEGMES